MTTPTLYTIHCEHGAHCTYCLTPDDRRPRTREDAEELAADIVATWDPDWGEAPLLTVEEAADEEIEEHLHDILPLLTAAPVECIEVYEDNAGGVWLVPVGHGIAIDMTAACPPALMDCRLYGRSWFAGDNPDRVCAASEIIDHTTLHVATYNPTTDQMEVHEDEHFVGPDARKYIWTRGDEAMERLPREEDS